MAKEDKLTLDEQQEQRVKAYNAQLGGGSPQNQVDPDGEQPSGETDYYQLLKDESYKAMLDSEIQASNARDQALKYTKAGVDAAGFGTQGLAESSRVGIFNTYQNALAGAQEVNRNNQVDIAAQQIEAQKSENNDNFESMTTLMGNASDLEQLDTILGNYDIQVENGVLTGKGLDELDTNTKRQLQSIYTLYSSQLGQSFSPEGKSSFNKYDDFASLKTEAGVSATAKEGGVKNEVEYILEDEEFLATLTNDRVVCLQNGNNPDSKVYLQFHNGNWYQVDANTYWNSTNRQLVKGK